MKRSEHVGNGARADARDYELLKKLASGGMAEIYLARAQRMEGFRKYVVLKRVLPHQAADDVFVKMFLDEARLAATLHHQNIAQVFDIGRISDSYFFTMEYLHGEDLRAVVRKAARRGGTPLAHCLTIVAGAAAGLEYAHNKVGPDGKPLGIVHRDVSHSNIVVTFDGAIKLVDFGIASATTVRSHTQAGTVRGKVAYMSPEQCLGEELDRRSDIFSLGIVLYELTTGKRLFAGRGARNELDIMERIVNGEIPPPTSFDPTYPLDLEPILMRALSVDREQRYQTPRDLLIDIESFAANERFSLSQTALSSFMKELFGERPEPWVEIEQALQEPRRTVTLTISNPKEIVGLGLFTDDMISKAIAVDTSNPSVELEEAFEEVPEASEPFVSTTMAWLLGIEDDAEPFAPVAPSAVSPPSTSMKFLGRSSTFSRYWVPVILVLGVVVGTAIAYSLTRDDTASNAPRSPAESAADLRPTPPPVLATPSAAPTADAGAATEAVPASEVTADAATLAAPAGALAADAATQAAPADAAPPPEAADDVGVRPGRSSSQPRGKKRGSGRGGGKKSSVKDRAKDLVDNDW